MPPAMRAAQRVAEVERADQLVHRRRLPAGDDESVEVVELGRATDRRAACAPRLGEHPHVLADVALDGEHTDGEGGPGHDR